MAVSSWQKTGARGEGLVVRGLEAAQVGRNQLAENRGEE